ncbi:MAG: cation-translocating P-type ATPase [Oscillospiraceae bacterium]|nr:cation-translocating P-type ATPase [Oscillospiraceae bacterium]
MSVGKVAGLSRREAELLLLEHGENRLEQGKKISPLKIFAGQFRDLMIMILLASTVVSVLMGQVSEAVAIIVIVLVNAVLGFVQEYRTEKTLEALSRMAAPTARVLREGKRMNIPADQIVPGDVILLSAGDKIPADARVIESVALECDESLLTGESLPVEKRKADRDDLPKEIGRADLVYMGAIVTKGRGTAVVTATGMETEMGRIAGMLHTIEDELTPLQKRLGQLGKYIAIGCLGICAVVTITGILRGEDIFNMFLVGISLAVAAVPEGLPAIVTIALALAVSRILKRRALVRRLHAVETMGCANVICTDKTGTLTENRMTVRKVFTLDYDLDVSGNGYERAGEFSLGGRRANTAASPALTRLFEIAAVCNNAQLTSPEDELSNRDRTASNATGSWEVIGDPTEIALMVLAAKAGLSPDSGKYRKLDEIPFDSDRKRMSVLVESGSGKGYIFSKGAPDLLLDRCKYVMTDAGVTAITPAHRKAIESQAESMAGQALRVLGFACKDGKDKSRAEDDLCFVGLAGMIDPPRKEVYGAVERCKTAKIRPVMITGDHKVTACAIARDVGIMGKNDRVMTGAEIDALPEHEFEQIAHKVAVFARVSPGHKLKIVRALKKRGDVVAMTGDGVNDAPAVKEADIGVSMGISGTDVTKQAASIILLDDNFATLVASIEEGRVVYANIRKFIRYLISCNIGEVVTMFVGMLMGLPIILLPIQILLVNLATDGLPAMALGLEPAEDDIMTRAPRPAGEGVFSNGLATTIIFRGFVIGLTTLLVFTNFVRLYGDIPLARTAALVTLIFTQLFHVFECKSEEKSLFQIKLLSNPALVLAVAVSLGMSMLTIYHPFMQSVLQTVSLSGEQILRVFGFSLIAPVLSSLWMMRPRKAAVGMFNPELHTQSPD